MVIKPGDTLLVEMDGSIPTEDAVRVKETLLRKLPGLRDVVVMYGVRVAGVWRGPEPHEASPTSDGTGICVHCGERHV